MRKQGTAAYTMGARWLKVTGALPAARVLALALLALSATTSSAADTQAPTAPTGLTATVASSSQINLSWTASTDNVGVAGYRVERCQGAGCTAFVEVASVWPSPTSFIDTGRGPAVSYSYRVRARDAAGNLSGYSNIASVTTLGSPDTIAPTAPEGLTANAWSASDIILSWAASTDNVGVTGYRVERCQGTGCTTFVEIFVTGWTSAGNSGLTAATSYSYRVRAADATGNLSGYSNVVSVTTLATSDTTRPTAPAGLTAVAVSASQITLSWTASTDNVAVANYYVVRCQGAGCTSFITVAVVGPTKTSFSDTGLTAATSYSYKVRAGDTVGYSAFSNVASATTGATAAAQIYYIHPDHLNTPRAIYDQQQRNVWRWDQQEPFGATPPNDDPDGDGIAFVFDLRLPGQYFDRETFTHYNYFRDYDPGIGRYISGDPIGLAGGLNLYVYVRGNPVSFVDPLGLQSVYTDLRGGTTTFSPAPYPGESFTIPTSSSVVLSAQPGANGGFSTPDVRVISTTDNPTAYGPPGTYIDTGDPRGRDIHGGGSCKGPLGSQEPRQGWCPTLGCIRGQNEDVQELGRRIQQFQQQYPGVPIPYFRY